MVVAFPSLRPDGDVHGLLRRRRAAKFQVKKRGMGNGVRRTSEKIEDDYLLSILSELKMQL